MKNSRKFLLSLSAVFIFPLPKIPEELPTKP